MSFRNFMYLYLYTGHYMTDLNLIGMYLRSRKRDLINQITWHHFAVIRCLSFQHETAKFSFEKQVNKL